MAQNLPEQTRMQEWADRQIGVSRFQDNVWEFDDSPPGAPRARLNWNFEMPDGSMFTDLQWASLCFCLRVFMYSLFQNRVHGVNLTGRTVKRMFHSSQKVVRFMALNGCEALNDLEPAVIDQYVHYLLRQALEDQQVTDTASTVPKAAASSSQPLENSLELLDSDVPAYQAEEGEFPEILDGLSDDEIEEAHTAVWRVRDAVYLFSYAYEQSAVLASEGIPVLPEHPFKGEPIKHAISRYVDIIVEHIPPVPDELYLPTTSALVEWLDVPADDIIRLQAAYLDAVNKFGYRDREKLSAILCAFRFSTLPGQAKPWHEPLAAEEQDSNKPLYQLKELVCELGTAGIMSVGAFVGQRSSEKLSLQALPFNTETGLPYCVEIQSSLDGLYDVFLIRGRLFKTKKTSEEAVWTAGMRLKGSKELPLPVRAIMVLYELYKPWREAAGLTDLCVGFVHNRYRLPNITKGNCCIAKTNAKLNKEQNAWIQKYVDVPPEYKDWRVTTTQWRKSFATYMIRANPGLLRAVSEHFHHMSVSMTNNAYVSKDVKMRGLLESAAITETAKAMHQMITGKVRIGGKMAELVRERKVVIMARLAGKTEKGQIAELEQMVKDANVRIYACDWGWCLFRSATSRCNHHKGTGALLKSRGPDLAKRCPDTCYSCKNLAVTDEHRVYWEERQHKYEKNAQEHRAAGNIGAAAVAQERVEQAQSVLRLMDLTMDSTEGGK